MLKAEGIGAVQINRLCAEFGVTRGSFYWHFADLEALKTAIAARWCTETREALEELSGLHHLPPRERLRVMTLRLIEDTSWSVERALREWARTDSDVNDVIAESDLFVFSVVEGALLELGLPQADARSPPASWCTPGSGSPTVRRCCRSRTPRRSTGCSR